MRSGRDRHIKRIHRTDRIPCRHGCGKTYIKRCDSLHHYERTCDINPAAASVGGGIHQQHHQHTANSKMELIKTAHTGNYRLFRRSLNSDRNVYEKLRHVTLNDVRGILRQQRGNVKYYVTGNFVFEKPHRPGVVTDPSIFLSSNPIATTSSKPIEQILEKIYNEIVEKVESFQRNGSGWVLRDILDVDLRVMTYDPTRANSYLKLPEIFNKSHSILNIRNDDDKCALWCILAHLFPKHQHNERIHRDNNPTAYREHEHQLITRDVEFPLKISDVGKLERWNNLAINIFSIEKLSNLIPIRISEASVPSERVVDLLYVVNGENSHYCLITNICGILRSQGSHARDANFLCRRCEKRSSSKSY